MTQKLSANPEALKILNLINTGFNTKEDFEVFSVNSDLLMGLLKGNYIQKFYGEQFTLTHRGYKAIKGDTGKPKGIKADPRELVTRGELKFKPHPRQADMDAFRAIPSLWNGERYVTK
jgi:hypothetical protein